MDSGQDMQGLPEGYTRLETLGSGTMGAVHLARRDEDGRLVALKVVLRPHPTLSARLQREADILAKVRHPHLPELVDAGTTDQGPWLAMEYVAGSSLDHLKPDRREAMLAMMQVGGALEALHRVSLLHRDVKPANILQDEDGRVVLADLGLALDPERTRLTETGLVGSPAFLAPEILDGESDGDPRTDWYAWGMTLFWLLEHRYPIDADRFQARLANPDCPWPEPTFSRIRAEGATAELVRRCLAEDPTARPTTVAEARAILRQASPGAGAGAARAASPASTGALSMGGEGRPTWWHTALAIVLAVGFGIGIGIGEPDAPRPEPAASPTATSDTRPRATTEGPGAPAGAFPVASLARLEEILEDPEGYAIGRGGALVPAERIAQEDLAILDLDPRSYGRRLRGLPGVADFFAWLAAGGLPEELAPEVRSRLEAADQVFRAGGLLPPFQPFLEAAPSDLLTVDREDWGEFEVRERAFEGWAAGAALAFREALTRAKALGDALEEDPEDALRVDLPDQAEVMSLFEAEAFLVPLLEQKGFRIRIAEYLRQAIQPLRRALYCAGRALAAEPGHREDLAVFFGRATTYANLLFHAEPAGLDAAQLLGRAPRTPADHCLVGDALRKAMIFHGHMGADQTARVQEMPAFWARAMGEDPETAGTPDAAARRQRARSRLTRFHSRWDQQHQGLRDLPPRDP